MSEVRRIPLTSIVADLAIQQRARGTSEDVVNEYAEAMRDGDKFPAVVVSSDDDRTFYLADGFHRIDAHRLAHCDVPEIECEVHHGNREDALVFGCSANSGLRRDPSDQRKAVASLLEVRPEWADRAIARHCKVSPTLVANVRKEHLQTTFIDAAQKEGRTEVTPAANQGQKTEATAVAPDRKRVVVRGGKQYPMKTARIGAGRAKPSRRKTAAPRAPLTSLAWSDASEADHAKFVDAVGLDKILDAFKAIHPGFDMLEWAWGKATSPAERQAFAKEHNEEINALAKAPGPTITVASSVNPTPNDTHHIEVEDDRNAESQLGLF
jgi:hypothetical protein